LLKLKYGFYWQKSCPNIGATFVNFEILPVVFAQSGHPEYNIRTELIDNIDSSQEAEGVSPSYESEDASSSEEVWKLNQKGYGAASGVPGFPVSGPANLSDKSYEDFSPIQEGYGYIMEALDSDDPYSEVDKVVKFILEKNILVRHVSNMLPNYTNPCNTFRAAIKNMPNLKIARFSSGPFGEDARNRFDETPIWAKKFSDQFMYPIKMNIMSLKTVGSPIYLTLIFGFSATTNLKTSIYKLVNDTFCP
jgi:hypothetical protein